jgi:hypothetical protein
VTQPARRRVAAAESASVLEKKLRIFRGDLTIADAAARGGLALRDAEAALYHLSSEYHGHLKATSEGELLFSFPRGLKKPQNQGPLARAARAVGRAVLGVGRFIIRAWVSVVMVGYALILLGVLIALALKDDGDGIGDALGLVFRIVAEALFWTFHPFSPVLWEREPAWAKVPRRGQRTTKIPFYEKVNRFVFGPPQPRVIETARERLLVAEVRRLDGRLGPGDIMRVVGGTRAEAEALLCRLVLDYDGQIEVSEEGAVIYRFASLRRTANPAIEHATPPVPIWTQREPLPKLTGNPVGTNVLLGAINGFNLTVGGVALANGLTIERLLQILSERAGDVAAAPLTGFPVFFGAIPFAFSTALVALPAARLLTSKARARKVTRENARRALLSALVDGPVPEIVEATELRRAWLAGGGSMPTEAEMTEEVRRLGGEPDVNETGKLIYRFEDLSRESKALAADRKQAPAAERSVGQVLFDSLDGQDES